MELFCVKKERFWIGLLIAFFGSLFFGRTGPAGL